MGKLPPPKFGRPFSGHYKASWRRLSGIFEVERPEEEVESTVAKEGDTMMIWYGGSEAYWML